MSVWNASLRVARPWRDLGAAAAIAVAVCGSDATAQTNQGPVDVLIPRLGAARKP
jgi:hypothetical protein